MAARLSTDGALQTGRADGQQTRAGAGTVYAPTLLIGLGGTGAEVLRRVKKLLRLRRQGGSDLHRFLYLDTDYRTFTSRSGLPDVESHEQCLIGVDRARDAVQNPDLYSHLWERFPREELQETYVRDLARGRGAKQIRSLGALAFALDFRKVRNAMRSAYNDLIQLSGRVQQRLRNEAGQVRNNVMIYLVGSLAGGTGSGCYLDTALLSRDVCAARNPRLVGMFALPEAFDQKLTEDEQKVSIRANTYAALKEIQFCLDAGEKERREVGTITFEYGRDLGSLELDPQEKVFDLCLTVSDRSEKGRLDSLEDLYGLLARSVYQDVGSPFGANVQSFQSNTTVLAGGAHCPKTGRRRELGTVSTASLVYPAERVADYCSFQSANAVVHDELLSDAPSAGELRGAVTTFLNRHDLEERGSENQLLGSLLYDPEYEESISASTRGKNPTWGEELDAGGFVRTLRDDLAGFREDYLADVKDYINLNRERRLGGSEALPTEAFRDEVEAFALGFAADHGARAAVEALDELEETAVEMKEALQAEAQRWQVRQRDRERSEFDRLCDELEQMGRIHQALSGRDEELKADLRRQYNVLVRQELQAAARPVALDVLEKLVARVREARSGWEALVTRLESLARTLRRESRRAESHTSAGRQEAFVVEREVTRAGYEEDYYEEKAPGTGEALSLVLNALDGEGEQAGRPQLFRRALELGRNEFGNVLLGPIGQHFAGPLERTSLVDFAREHPEDLRGEATTLAGQLDLLDELCSPFWQARALGGVELPEFRGLTAEEVEVDDQGNSVYHDVVAEWADENEFQLIPSKVPYELMLGRRTYGARAFYLRSAARWKERYETRLRSSEGRFMLQTHAAFRRAPDLFPEEPGEGRPLRYFALGAALGFVVRRGNWYYYGLERRDTGSEEILRVRYAAGNGETVADLEETPEVPERAGRVHFGNTTENLAAEDQLAQGRENAVEALRERDELVQLLHEAFQEYRRHVGDGPLREQLVAYCDRVLEPKVQEQGDLFSRELEEIRAKARSLST